MKYRIRFPDPEPKFQTTAISPFLREKWALPFWILSRHSPTRPEGAPGEYDTLEDAVCDLHALLRADPSASYGPPEIVCQVKP